MWTSLKLLCRPWTWLMETSCSCHQMSDFCLRLGICLPPHQPLSPGRWVQYALGILEKGIERQPWNQSQPSLKCKASMAFTYQNVDGSREERLNVEWGIGLYKPAASSGYLGEVKKLTLDNQECCNKVHCQCHCNWIGWSLMIDTWCMYVSTYLAS